MLDISLFKKIDLVSYPALYGGVGKYIHIGHEVCILDTADDMQLANSNNSL